jgi:molecular chaperone GrpE
MTQASENDDETAGGAVIIEAEAVEVTVAAPVNLSEAIAYSELAAMRARLDSLEKIIGQLVTAVEQLSERTNLIPKQVRQLGNKVDDMTESISQPRLRDLLHSVLLLFDLVEQMSRAVVDEDNGRNYQVLRDQLLQILRVNGITFIPTSGAFDPALHKAVATLPCDTVAEDEQIAQVYRAGFQTEHAILRYAEVVVKHYQAPA